MEPLRIRAESNRDGVRIQAYRWGLAEKNGATCLAKRRVAGIVGPMLRTRLLLFGGFVMVLATGGCDEIRHRLFNLKVKVRCPVMEGRCKFTNEGDPGNACVTVVVKHEITGEVIRSQLVCSEKLKTNEVRWVPIPWSGREPLEFCMGPDYKKDFAKECSVTIEEEGSNE